MSERTATRSVVIELREESRAMREGCAFLDEKCLLLAAAMLAELRRVETLDREIAPARAQAARMLRLALARHGLNGLQCQPAPAPGTRQVAIRRRFLLGVVLHEAALEGLPGPVVPAVHPSPEARECGAAYAAYVALLTRRAAMSANLARLQAEYKRTTRRVHALEDVVLPEIEGDLGEIEAILAESEQDEALWARFGRRHLSSQAP